jgi:hypothetical protein
VRAGRPGCGRCVSRSPPTGGVPSPRAGEEGWMSLALLEIPAPVSLSHGGTAARGSFG